MSVTFCRTVDGVPADTGRVRVSEGAGLDDAAVATALKAGLVPVETASAESPALAWVVEPAVAMELLERGVAGWRITVRDDGRLECGGALPTLIEWQGPHPCDAMPASPVALTALSLCGMPPAASAVLRLAGVDTERTAGPPWQARLRTPRGEVMLSSWTADQAATTDPI